MKKTFLAFLTLMSSLMLANGQNFTLDRSYGIYDIPIVTVTGDCSGDSKNDVIVLCRPMGWVNTLFRAYVFHQTDSQKLALVDTFTYYVSQGSPQLEEPQGGTLADFNHDGYQDLLFAYQGRVEIRYGDSSGTFSGALKQKFYDTFIGGITSFDVDNNGWEDVLYVVVNLNYFVVQYNEGTSFTAITYTDTSQFGHHYVHDNILAMRDGNTTVVILGTVFAPPGEKPLHYHVLNNSRGEDTVYYKESARGYEWMRNIDFIQYDADPALEVVGVTGSDIEIWDNTTSPMPIMSLPTLIEQPLTAVVGNLDCDASEEVFFVHYFNDTASIWDPADSSTTLVKLVYMDPAEPNRSVLLADVTDDGGLDIVYAANFNVNPFFELHIYKNLNGRDSTATLVIPDTVTTEVPLDSFTIAFNDTVGNEIHLDTVTTEIVESCVRIDYDVANKRDVYLCNVLTRSDTVVTEELIGTETCLIDTILSHARDTILLSKVEDPQGKKVKIYPPITDNEIYVEINTAIPYTVAIMDIHGNILRKVTAKTPRCSVSLKEFPSGMYFVEISTGDYMVTTKVTKL